MNRFIIIAGVAAAASLASATARAEEQQQLTVMDADKNGSVTRAEMTAYAKSVFDDLDTDGNDAISFKEMQADAEADRKALMDQAGRRPGPRADQLRARLDEQLKSSFDVLDADKNGSLSREEHLAAYEPGFKKADANGDDVVSEDELVAVLQERLDTRRSRRQ